MSRLVSSAMIAMLPPSDAHPGVDPVRARALARRLMRTADPVFLVGLVLGALVFHLTPLITVGIPLPAALLPAGARDRHADRIATHPVYLLKMAVLTVKMAAGMAWGADPSVRETLALPPYPDDPGTWRGSDTPDPAEHP